MDLLKTILIYLSMLFVSSVQMAPDPATVTVTPSPPPTPYGVVETATPVPTPSPTPVPTPAITPNTAYGQLNMGDRDENVAVMQKRLQELGYYGGELDGAYGNQTRHAVELFQYQNGLRVDGIAGRYTLTILYEDGDVKPAPTQIASTPTPAFRPDATATPPPSTETPTPGPTAEPTVIPEPTATPEPAETSGPSAAQTVPLLLDAYHFILSGFADPLKAQGTDSVLRPLEYEETLYVPLMEILRDAGSVIIENAEDSLREAAFTVGTDFYQVSYTQTGDGSLGNLVITKNAQQQPLAVRSALLADGIVYLPLADTERITGIGFAMDAAAGTVTVSMP